MSISPRAAVLHASGGDAASRSPQAADGFESTYPQFGRFANLPHFCPTAVFRISRARATVLQTAPTSRHGTALGQHEAGRGRRAAAIR